MEYFLQNIARHLNDEFGPVLNRHCLVFPNRRAGLYFMKYLASGITRPVWTPAVYTINELFAAFSSLQIASSEVLLFELYKVYGKIRNTAEKFDDFYFWGDLLINDFDDVDKYLVNVSLLFRNIKDIKDIDQQFGELTPGHVEIVRQFWINFNPARPTDQKKGFTDIWSVLYDLYLAFRLALKSKGIAYEGMIFRELAESDSSEFPQQKDWDLYHFIGFNALNECEKKVMKRLLKAGMARFYWDYDNSFINEGNLNSAGYFMRDNLRMFGNDMAADWKYDTLLSEGAAAAKRIVIETSSDVAQVKLLPGLIRGLPDLSQDSAHHTAIVLADENLLIPVLTSLPSDAGDINITMGYPLRHTLVYTFIHHLAGLQRNAEVSGGQVRFDHRDVLSVLKHPLAENLAGNEGGLIMKEIMEKNLLWINKGRFGETGYLSLLFSRPDSVSSLSDYFRNILTAAGSHYASLNEGSENRTMEDKIRNEFIYRAVLSINRLESIARQNEVVFSAETYLRILDRILRQQSVPFSGEPLSGIQIMGILETRALDFRNLIILSVNEGVLPSVSAGSSFIPFNLREAFGIPSINHQESIYAYHFYRLLERAENVTFLYNSSSDGLKTGEMSRFLIQMKYDEKLRPDFSTLSFEIRSHGPVGGVLERTEDHCIRLNSRFFSESNARMLSPSAINTWLNCRMKFYYRYVNDLREPETVTGEIDPAMLGELLHGIMFSIYSPFKSRVIDVRQIDDILKDSAFMDDVIRRSMDLKFSGGNDRKIMGTELIIREVLKAYVIRILKEDKRSAPISIIDLESVRSFPLEISIGGNSKTIFTGGIIDRIDNTGGIVRIVDYKTGSVAERIGSVSELFEDDRKKETDAWLQTLLYCEAFLTGNPGSEVRPSVYRIRKMGSSPGGDSLKIRTDGRNDYPLQDYRSVREEFLTGLRGVIGDIFSENSPFVMTEEMQVKCPWCPYRGLCTR